MVRININKIMTNKKTVLLAYDHGLEHGPHADFNLQTVNPEYVMNLALEGKFNGVILQHGVAEKYFVDHFRSIPLIIKLNGKTSLPHVPPVSLKLCTVERAIKLGACAVGYTLYPGSPEEQQMFVEFGKIVDSAHDYGLPVIAWAYPRGPGINDQDTNTIAYGARIAMEMGADLIKLHYNGDKDGFKWVAKCAGRSKVIISGADRTDSKTLLNHVFEAMNGGASGIAIGRNAWQHPRPFMLAKALQDIVFHNKSVDEAMRHLNE